MCCLRVHLASASDVVMIAVSDEIGKTGEYPYHLDCSCTFLIHPQDFPQNAFYPH
jgi:hypothetical protein